MAPNISLSKRGTALLGVAGLAVVAAYLVGDSHAGAAPPAPAPIVQTAATAGVDPASTGITVTGTGTATGTPDALLLDIGVQVDRSDVGRALADASSALSNVRAALTAHGVADADLQTAGLSIQPDYQNGSSTPTGYSVSATLTAKLRNLSGAGAAITTAAAAGGDATRIDGVSFDLQDDSSLLASARSAAFADAKARAVQYAAAAHRTLGPVIRITESAPATTPIYSGAASGSAPARGPSVPIDPGTSQLSASVMVVFALS